MKDTNMKDTNMKDTHIKYITEVYIYITFNKIKNKNLITLKQQVNKLCEQAWAKNSLVDSMKTSN